MNINLKKNKAIQPGAAKKIQRLKTMDTKTLSHHDRIRLQKEQKRL